MYEPKDTDGLGKEAVVQSIREAWDSDAVDGRADQRVPLRTVRDGLERNINGERKAPSGIWTAVFVPTESIGDFGCRITTEPDNSH